MLKMSAKGKGDGAKKPRGRPRNRPDPQLIDMTQGENLGSGSVYDDITNGDVLMKLKTSKIRTTNMLLSIPESNTNAIIVFDANGMCLQSRLSSGQGRILIRIPAENFDDYQYNSKEAAIVHGISLKNLRNIMPKQCGSMVCIYIPAENPEDLTIITDTKYDDTTTFHLSFSNTDEEIIEDGLKYNCEIAFDADYFAETFGNAKIMGKEADFVVCDDNFTISCVGNGAIRGSEKIIRPSDIMKITVARGLIVSGHFSIDDICKFIKHIKNEQMATMKIAQGTCLQIDYSIGNLGTATLLANNLR
jgi:hypothetical protein